MQIHHLSQKNSVLNHFLAQIRNVSVQHDRMRFRTNIARIGEIMAYEMSKTFNYDTLSVTTPLGIKNTTTISDALVLCSILRAGLALHQGFMNVFDEAENGFISAYRHHFNHDSAFDILVEYQAVPNLKDKIVIVVDPMLATGQSLWAVINKLHLEQQPKEIHLAVVVAAPEGIAFLENRLPPNCHLWIAAIDDKLNEENYIVPGLGDAGDLAYGEKL